MSSMTVANLESAFPPSQVHLLNLQEYTTASAKTPPQGSKGGVVYPDSPGEETSREGITHQPTQPITNTIKQAPTATT